MDVKNNNQRHTLFLIYYRQYRASLLTLLHKKIDENQAEEIIQEIFIEFYNKMEKIDNPRKWFYGALRIELLKFFREKSKPTEQTFDIEAFFDDVSMQYVNGYKDLRIIIKDAIECCHMSDYEKLIFNYIAVQNFSYSMTAKFAGTNKSQVSYYYHKSIQKIKAYLATKGISNIGDLL